MRFEFATAGRVLFGEGVVREAAAAAASMGTRPLLITGATGPRAKVCDGPTVAVAGEPTVDLVRRNAARAHTEGCDVIIAIGGGSAIDAGKAIAAMLANPGDPLNY